MLGKHYSAIEAERIGWINRAVPDTELDSHVAEWCRILLEASPQALRLTKTSIDTYGDYSLASVRHGFESLTHIYSTAEFHEGTTAFIENRPPRFREASPEPRRASPED
jgi:1,4-dihydroxy-2-naphthoyl-CoA synthase